MSRGQKHSHFSALIPAVKGHFVTASYRIILRSKKECNRLLKIAMVK